MACQPLTAPKQDAEDGASCKCQLALQVVHLPISFVHLIGFVLADTLVL